jgi:hypothetical protein
LATTTTTTVTAATTAIATATATITAITHTTTAATPSIPITARPLPRTLVCAACRQEGHLRSTHRDCPRNRARQPGQGTPTS